MKLWDIMPMDLFREMLIEKYIRVNKKGNLRLLNYTEKAQYENVWNEVTKQCRGLVINKNWEILARPFDKFQNYGYDAHDYLIHDYEVQVTDKMDGSLGILFYESGDPWSSPDLMSASSFRDAMAYGGQWHVATRGSFDSEQAQEMLKILEEKYMEKQVWDRYLRLDTNWTYMFEIIYPENRIVLDYGDTRDLFLLGARNNHTGLVRPAEAVSDWKGPRAKTFSYKTLTEALEAPPRPNAEGYVIYFPDLDYRVKLKQDDYVALHKIVTGLTARRIWELLKIGKTLPELIEMVPDEWHKWLDDTASELYMKFVTKRKQIRIEYQMLLALLPDDFTRKDFALLAKKAEYSSFMFMLFDNKNIDEKVWDLVKPEA